MELVIGIVLGGAAVVLFGPLLLGSNPPAESPFVSGFMAGFRARQERERRRAGRAQ